MTKIAIIIIGDVRECNVLKDLPKHFSNFDVYIGSYKKHQEYVNTIGKKTFTYLIDPVSDIRPPNGLLLSDMQQNMLQWLHLDNIIKKYHKNLLNYDYIFKFRFDIHIPNVNNYYYFFNKLILSCKDNKLYAYKDVLFYSNTNTFLNAFSNLYDTVINETFNDDNRNNNLNLFQHSWKAEPAIKYLFKRNNIIELPLNFDVHIIRGKYKKVTADGNKKLYDDDNNLLGKFQ